MNQHRVFWAVGLSNGENAQEDKGDFKVIDGELSPWQRLIHYVAEKGLMITSLQLFTADGKVFSLPSAGKNPKFKAFADAPQPILYRMYRKMAGDVMGGGEVTNQELFTVAEARYKDGTLLQIWVCNTSLNAWTMITKE